MVTQKDEIRLFKTVRIKGEKSPVLWVQIILTIQSYTVSLYIFKSLKNDESKKKSKSFIKDILSLEKYFKTSIELISETKTLSKLYNSLKDEFKQEDGVTDSIRTCFANYEDKSYRDLLADLIKPDFIREDEEFQLLLQYIIITNWKKTLCTL